MEQVAKTGPADWSQKAKHIKGRSGKSCRLRWCNQLRPGLVKGPFTSWEDAVIIRAQANWGNKWAPISELLDGRCDNSVKNHWHSSLKRQFSDGRHLLKDNWLDKPLQDLLAERPALFQQTSPDDQQTELATSSPAEAAATVSRNLAQLNQSISQSTALNHQERLTAAPVPTHELREAHQTGTSSQSASAFGEDILDMFFQMEKQPESAESARRYQLLLQSKGLGQSYQALVAKPSVGTGPGICKVLGFASHLRRKRSPRRQRHLSSLRGSARSEVQDVMMIDNQAAILLLEGTPHWLG